MLRSIEKELQDSELKNNDSSGVDVMTIFEFKSNFAGFQFNIDKTVKLQIEFWNELIEENPDIQKLINLASALTMKFEELDKMFIALSAYDLNSSRYLELYSRFLKEIMHDEFESKRISEKLDLMSKNRASNHDAQEDKNDNYGDNNNCLIITMNGNKEGFCNMLSVGNEITNVLKYKPSEIVGNNVSMLMPDAYSKNHDSYVRRYVESGEARIIGKKRNLYAMDKRGYLKGCSLFLKVLPDLTDVR
jgi:hypothetical protein